MYGGKIVIIFLCLTCVDAAADDICELYSRIDGIGLVVPPSAIENTREINKSYGLDAPIITWEAEEVNPGDSLSFYLREQSFLDDQKNIEIISSINPSILDSYVVYPNQHIYVPDIVDMSGIKMYDTNFVDGYATWSDQNISEFIGGVRSTDSFFISNQAEKVRSLYPSVFRDILGDFNQSPSLKSGFARAEELVAQAQLEGILVDVVSAVGDGSIEISVGQEIKDAAANYVAASLYEFMEVEIVPRFVSTGLPASNLNIHYMSAGSMRNDCRATNALFLGRSLGARGLLARSNWYFWAENDMGEIVSDFKLIPLPQYSEKKKTFPLVID